ncbi:MAG: hypothetical protein FWF14_02250 [Streptococcaceae bacterium]|nr:hypothetical protein [Streptococcaceae bacterium]
MATTVKNVGHFSKKYDYIQTNDDSYFLIDKSTLSQVDRVDIIGEEVPSKFNREKNKSKQIQLTGVSLICYLSICFILTWVFRKNVFFIIFLWSSTLHEFSHILTAIRIKSFNIWCGFGIKYFIFPIIYVSNKDIYKKSKNQRILYYSAGVLFNLSLAVICATIIYLFHINNLILQLIMIINFSMGMFNLYPFMFTDGFNVFRELTERYDLREILVQNRFNLKKLSHKGKFYLIYGIFSLGTFVISIMLLITQIIKQIISLG